MQLQPREALPKIMLARYYGSSAARFVSPDPLSPLGLQHRDRQAFETLLANPAVWNRYSYVLNNPLYYTDPSGRRADAVAVGTNLLIWGQLDPLPIEEILGLAILGATALHAAIQMSQTRDSFDRAMSQLDAAEADLMGHPDMDPEDDKWWNQAKRFLDKINNAIRLKGEVRNKELRRILDERITKLLDEFYKTIRGSCVGPPIGPQVPGDPTEHIER